MRTDRAADPVLLHGPDVVGPIDVFQVVQQSIRVRGDPHHPLRQRLAEHREVAALAAAVGGDFLVGQHGAQTRAPVHRRLGAIDQAVVVDDRAPLQVVQFGPRLTRRIRAVVGLAPAVGQFFDQFRDRTGGPAAAVVPGVEDLQEDPLRPSVEGRVAGGQGAALVVAQTHPAQLPAERVDVGVGGCRRMLSGLHRVLLGRQPERVETHRVQDILAAHAQIARVDVGADVAERVPDVQAVTGRVREHVHDVGVGPDGHPVEVLGQRPARVGRVERALALPPVLPGQLDRIGQRRGVTVGRRVAGSRVARYAFGRPLGRGHRCLLFWVPDSPGVGPGRTKSPCRRQRLNRADKKSVSAARREVGGHCS